MSPSFLMRFVREETGNFNEAGLRFRFASSLLCQLEFLVDVASQRSVSHRLGYGALRNGRGPEYPLPYVSIRQSQIR